LTSNKKLKNIDLTKIQNMSEKVTQENSITEKVVEDTTQEPQQLEKDSPTQATAPKKLFVSGSSIKPEVENVP
jgi:hypothetical protein